MEKIRIGNDFTVEWSIIRRLNGESSEYNLEGRNLVLKCVSPYTTIEVKDFSVEGNVIKWPFYGKDQKATGIYSLILEENKGEYGMVTIDVISAFMLVPHTKDEQRSSNSALAIEKIELTSEVVIGVGASVTVDSELLESSENPVQNKVVTSALNALGEALDTINDKVGTKADADAVAALSEGLDRKVDKVAGKGLSTEDFTTAEKSKLGALRNYDDSWLKDDLAELQTGKQDKREFVTLDENTSGTINLYPGKTYWLKSNDMASKSLNPIFTNTTGYEGEVIRFVFYSGSSTGFAFPPIIIWNEPLHLETHKFYDITLEIVSVGSSPIILGRWISYTV